MKLVNPNSYEGYVNHFADYLVSKFDGRSTRFIVTYHFPNIFVISGVNSNKGIINYSSVHESFLEEFPHYYDILDVTKNDISNFRFIDTVNSHNNPKRNNSRFLETNWFEFHNTPRPTFNSFQMDNFVSPTHKEYLNIDKNSITKFGSNYGDCEKEFQSNICHHNIQSSFPFGYNKEYRSIFYSAEFLANNLFRITKTPSMWIHNTQSSPAFISSELRIVCNSKYSEKHLLSLTMDSLCDYDIYEYIEDYNITDDLFHPIADKPWLEPWKVGELIIF